MGRIEQTPTAWSSGREGISRDPTSKSLAVSVNAIPNALSPRHCFRLCNPLATRTWSKANPFCCDPGSDLIVVNDERGLKPHAPQPSREQSKARHSSNAPSRGPAQARLATSKAEPWTSPSAETTPPPMRRHMTTPWLKGRNSRPLDVGRVLTRWPSIDARHLVGCGCKSRTRLMPRPKRAHVTLSATAPLRPGMRHENAFNFLRILNVDISRT